MYNKTGINFCGQGATLTTQFVLIKSKHLVYENCNVCKQSRTAAVGKQEGDCLTHFVVLYPAS